MSRTLVSGKTGKVLFGISGNFECPILGRTAYLMGLHDIFTEENGGILHLQIDELEKEKIWLKYTQPYSLNAIDCQRFAHALSNVTDDIIDQLLPDIYPEISKSGLKQIIQYYGHYYKRLKNGYNSV